MPLKSIRQAVTKESLFNEIRSWCSAGAGRSKDSLHILSAFATGSAVEALEPHLDVFVADGNRVDVIVGIDRGGTSRDAIDLLYQLQDSHGGRVACSVFYAPSVSAIFHPKLYIYKQPKLLSAVIGSANLTIGGLSNNFESLFAIRSINPSTQVGQEIWSTWETYANPHSPLKPSYLRRLDRDVVREIKSLLPKSSKVEKEEKRGLEDELWKPISAITLPRSGVPAQRRRQVRSSDLNAYLLIDVLQETRSTQMQLPLAVVESFFGLMRDQEGAIRLSSIRSGAITQPIDRRIVKSSGNEGHRLMRRIEMPQISGQTRPLGAVFLRHGPDRFFVAILPQSSEAYRSVDDILKTHGQQPKHAKRRYYVGSRSDGLMPRVRSVVSSTLD